GNGMPRVASFMVRYQAATRSLVVATHGRGMFRLKLLQPAVTVSAASFERSALAVEGIASVFAADLADRTEVAGTIPLPTQLAGISVRISDSTDADRLAPLFAVSTKQVNYQIPPETVPGPITVLITKGDNATAFGIERVSNVVPAIFTANSNGSGVASGVAVLVRNGTQTFLPIARLDNTLNPPQYVPEPIDLGGENDQVVLVLYASGARRRSDLSAVKASIGGLELQPSFVGPAPGFIGLDQLNIPLSKNLAGRNVVDVSVRADGVRSNIVKIAVK